MERLVETPERREEEEEREGVGDEVQGADYYYYDDDLRREQQTPILLGEVGGENCHHRYHHHNNPTLLMGGWDQSFLTSRLTPSPTPADGRNTGQNKPRSSYQPPDWRLAAIVGAAVPVLDIAENSPVDWGTARSPRTPLSAAACVTPKPVSHFECLMDRRLWISSIFTGDSMMHPAIALHALAS